MTPDDVAKSLAAAAHAWSPDAVSCVATDGSVSHPYLEIVPGMASAGAAAPHAANDGHNEVIFIIAGWQDEGHPVEAVAVTTITKKRDGRILDADVEINAEWDSWTNFDPGATVTTGNGQADPFDLQNAITHEFGHFIGLDHTCFGPADSVRQIDNNGNPVFDCDFAPASVKATVMYATIDSAGIETSKRYLTSDDVARGLRDLPGRARSAGLLARHARRRLRLRDGGGSWRHARLRPRRACSPCVALPHDAVELDADVADRRLAESDARGDVELLLGGAEPGRHDGEPPVPGDERHEAERARLAQLRRRPWRRPGRPRRCARASPRRRSPAREPRPRRRPGTAR